MSKIEEYLFIDRPRVESYFQQIKAGKSLLRHEKASQLSFGIAVDCLGPKGEETVEFRDPTLIEKLEEVHKQITKAYRLKPGLFRKATLDAVFQECDFKATRAVIFPGKEANEKIPRLAIWIVNREDTKISGKAIYLIEAPNASDPAALPVFSGYSALQFLVDNDETCTAEFRRTLLAGQDEGEAKQASQALAKDPIGYLKRLGARMSGERRIHSLFRVRLRFVDIGIGQSTEGIIGYPLYIAAAD